MIEDWSPGQITIALALLAGPSVLVLALAVSRGYNLLVWKPPKAEGRHRAGIGGRHRAPQSPVEPDWPWEPDVSQEEVWPMADEIVEGLPSEADWDGEP